MNKEMISEGDICLLDEKVEFPTTGKDPYPVLVLWHGVNGQPLVTRPDSYSPFWTTYSQLVERIEHLDLSAAVADLWKASESAVQSAMIDRTYRSDPYEYMSQEPCDYCPYQR